MGVRAVPTELRWKPVPAAFASVACSGFEGSMLASSLGSNAFGAGGASARSIWSRYCRNTGVGPLAPQPERRLLAPRGFAVWCIRRY